MVIDCSKYAGKCACGRVHTMETRAAVIEPGCLFEFEKYMAQFGVTGKRCALRQASARLAADRACPDGAARTRDLHGGGAREA